MAYVHVGHNCIINSNVIMANVSSLAGHVEVEDRAFIGGLTGIHQFTRIGRMAMVAGYARVVKDVPPYSLVAGQPARLYGLNNVGLKRQNISQKARIELKRAYKIISKRNRMQALEEIKATINPCDEITNLINFLEAPSKRGVILRMCDDQESGDNVDINLNFSYIE